MDNPPSEIIGLFDNENTVVYVHLFGFINEEEIDLYHKVICPPEINTYDLLSEFLAEILLSSEWERIEKKQARGQNGGQS